MNNQNDRPKIPDLETRQRNVARMRQVCQQIDALTYELDELIAMVEAENRRSPLTLYRLNKLKQAKSLEQTQN